MINQSLIVVLLVLSFIVANMPWLSDKVFLFKSVTKKSAWWRWLESFVGYLLLIALGLAAEYKSMGTLSTQDWEFYVVTLCLFVVLALPGFIYCYDLKRMFKNSTPKG